MGDLTGPRIERLAKILAATTGVGREASKASSSAGQKDKKRKKDEVQNKDNGKLRRTGTPMELLVGRAAGVATTTVNSDDSSGDSNAATWAGQSTGPSQFSHRTMRPGASALKKKRSKSAPKEGRLAFVSEHTLVRETSIVSFRHCGEKLWVTNPEANVMCEVCMKRFPQQGGRLSGGTGFMSHQSFHCHKCSANIEDDDESDE